MNDVAFWAAAIAASLVGYFIGKEDAMQKTPTPPARQEDPRYVHDGMNKWVKCGPSCSLRVLGYGQTTCACRTQPPAREQ